jgi:hypothetical protein
MQFLYPTILWALFLLAIPIAIHLFNLRRYKTVYFSDTRFLKELQQSTKRQRKLKEWLVLFNRLLLLTFLILAFARPYLPVADRNFDESRVLIVLDNSASTQVGKDARKPFEKGKQMALKVLAELPSETEVALLHAAKQDAVSFQSIDEVTKQIKELNVVDRSLSLENSTWNALDVNALYLFSDLQKNELNANALAADSTRIIIIPTANPNADIVANQRIDSVWIEAPILLAGQEVPIFFSVRNYGSVKTNVTIEVLTNQLPEITISGDIRAQSDSVFSAMLTQLSRGFNTVELNLKNDAVSFDNRFYGAYFLPIANNVVEIYEDEPNPIIGNLFSSNEFQFANMAAKAVDNAQLSNADLIILNEVTSLSSGLENILIQATETANLLIIPPAEHAQRLNPLCKKLGVQQYGRIDTATLASKRINTSDPYFADVFSGNLDQAYWPTAQQHYKLTGTTQLPTFRLIELANDDPFFVRYSNQQTNILQLTTPLGESFSDITTHPVIVPLFIKALLKKNSISGFTGYAGVEQRFDLELTQPAGEQAIQLKQGGNFLIPRQRIRGKQVQFLIGTEITRMGHYTLAHEAKDIGKLAFNIPILESDLQRFNPDELRDWLSANGLDHVVVVTGTIETIQNTIREYRQGIQLWRYALGLALLFLLLEIFLLRFLK